MITQHNDKNNNFIIYTYENYYLQTLDINLFILKFG